MFENSIRRMPRPQDVQRLNTQELRDTFLIANLFVPDPLTGTFTDLYRLAVGGVMPVKPVELPNDKETGRAFFLERRELGAINVGGAGGGACGWQDLFARPAELRLSADGHPVGHVREQGREESGEVLFPELSGHAAHPAAMMKPKEATPVPLGSATAANQRTIYKYIHPGGIQSCQLVMGFTALDKGSVWNSFPPHTHWRRTEIYFYFDLGGNVLTHFLGEPQQTRHLFLHNEEAALSPNWSIHCGCGTGNYKFIWGMAGENQMFDDMDGVKPVDLR